MLKSLESENYKIEKSAVDHLYYLNTTIASNYITINKTTIDELIELLNKAKQLL